MTSWQIEFDRTVSGAESVREYLAGLFLTDEARMVRALTMLERLGVQLGMPHARQFAGTDLRDLRIRGGTQHQVFYVAIRGQNLLLLHAFGKKTEKTPANEIRTAQRRLADYRERFGT